MRTGQRRSVRELPRVIFVLIGVIVVLLIGLVLAAIAWVHSQESYLHERRVEISTRLNDLHDAQQAQRRDLRSLACLLIRGIPPGTLPGVDKARDKYHCAPFVPPQHCPRVCTRSAQSPPAPTPSVVVSVVESPSERPPATATAPPGSSASPAPTPSSSSTPRGPPSSTSPARHPRSSHTCAAVPLVRICLRTLSATVIGITPPEGSAHDPRVAERARQGVAGRSTR